MSITAASAAVLLVHEPATFANLTIFALQPARLPAEQPQNPGAALDFLVLEEALRDQQARLHETGDVGQLEIENLAELDLFLQAGDMVKGGKQDRTLGADLIVPAKSGRMPIPAFCVEQGRWARRKKESAAEFSASTEAVASRALRAALRKQKSQAAVWQEVAALQAKLGQNVAEEVTAAESPTSLQLSMEAAPVRRRIEEYQAALQDAVERWHPQSCGFAFAINGRPTGAEVYGSAALFRKFWPKLLRAAATEALAEVSAKSPGTLSSAGCDSAEVSRWLGGLHAAGAGGGSSTREEVITPRVTLVTRETAELLSFETLDAARANLCVHQSVISQ